MGGFRAEGTGDIGCSGFHFPGWQSMLGECNIRISSVPFCNVFVIGYRHELVFEFG